MRENRVRVALGIGVLVVLSACSSGGASSPDPDQVSGLGSGGSASSGGAGAGGAAATGGVSAAGGAAAVPPGQLVCRGKPCHAGGRCAADGSCPAFLGDCFSTPDHLETCEEYCTAHGFVCAEKSCNMDGSPSAEAFTSVSFRVAHAAECSASGIPDNETQEGCGSIIWLSASMPQDALVRCCCQG